MTDQVSKAMIKLSPRDLRDIKSEFIRMDVNGDGFLSAEEFARGFGQTDMNRVKKIIEQVDVNGDGKLDFTEILSMIVHNRYKENDIDARKAAFDIYDVNGDGTISR